MSATEIAERSRKSVAWPVRVAIGVIAVVAVWAGLLTLHRQQTAEVDRQLSRRDELIVQQRKIEAEQREEELRRLDAIGRGSR